MNSARGIGRRFGELEAAPIVWFVWRVPNKSAVVQVGDETDGKTNKAFICEREPKSVPDEF